MDRKKQYAWDLVLFLSVDLANSTAFKAKNYHITSDDGDDKPRSGQPWLEAFEFFYTTFPVVFNSYYGHEAAPSANKERSPSIYDKPHIWKLLGDEILFYVSLQNINHAVQTVDAFRQSILDFNARLNSRPEYRSLRCKGAAWTAGFPVINSKIAITIDNKDNLDFVGPSIDIGFRLSKHSNDRRFIVSAELLLLLLCAPTDTHVRPFRFHFHKKEELHGVLHGAAYPIVWIDMLDQDPIEDLLNGTAVRHCPHKMLRLYIEEFIGSTPGLFSPFIVGPAPFGAPTTEFLEIQKQLIQSNSKQDLEQEKYDDFGEKPDNQVVDSVTPPKVLQGAKMKTARTVADVREHILALLREMPDSIFNGTDTEWCKRLNLKAHEYDSLVQPALAELKSLGMIVFYREGDGSRNYAELRKA